jgi:hypothetical protein
MLQHLGRRKAHCFIAGGQLASVVESPRVSVAIFKHLLSIILDLGFVFLFQQDTTRTATQCFEPQDIMRILEAPESPKGNF